MEKDLTKKLYEELKKRNIFEEDETEETDDNVGSDDKFCEMVCNILHSRNQTHVFHLQTQSFAEHKALNDYYDGIIPLFDGIVESYQGKYGIIKNFKTFEIEQYQNNEKTISYFNDLLNIIEENRNSVKDSYIQNQIDTVQELINSTIYKLKFLK